MRLSDSSSRLFASSARLCAASASHPGGAEG
jgi:hypothetical protein